MKSRIVQTRSRTARAAAAVAVGGGALVLAAAPALSDSSDVSARWVSETVTGPACASPVGLCVRGTMKGDLKGTFEFTASDVHATSDTPETAVLHYAGDMVITTADGTLNCKDSGALSNRPDGSVASLCVVRFGTGRFAGMSGQLRSMGTWPLERSDGSLVSAGQGVWEGRIEP